MLESNLQSLIKLSPNDKPLWGKMSSQHMVEHLIHAVRLSNGQETITECMTPEERLPLMKKILMSNRQLPKNFVNTVVGEGLKPLQYKNLIEAKETLKVEITKFENYFSENPETVLNNPTFGPLNKEEWTIFHMKHFDHHFRQFGLLEE